MVAISYSEVKDVIAEIEKALGDGLFIVALFSYELGGFFNNLSLGKFQKPLIIAWAFKKVEKVSKSSVDLWLSQEIEEDAKGSKKSLNNSGICNVRMNSNEMQYEKKIKKIFQNILLGNTYQVNYTFKVYANAYGSPVDLYMKLRERQPSRFGALIRDNGFNVMSFSPEWFVELDNGTLRAKPMKGTLAVAGSKPSDLSKDKKNRAENIMIVDLLRNDLGRISEIGSVKVPKLFEIERVGEIFQMTSTVESKIKKNIGLEKLLEAIYPCGSVTGAPKNQTMKIIKDLENEDRGFYCGSIGWLDPCSSPNSLLGNLMMSVSIRTAVMSGHNLTFGVGSGITIDSNYKEEWKECLLKASFLVRLPSGVGLFETIRIEGNVPKFLKNHIIRLIKSAGNFGIPCDPDLLEELVHQKISRDNIQKNKLYKLKITLSPEGNYDIEINPLENIDPFPKIFWAAELIGKQKSVVDSRDPTFYHKTTSRYIYDRAWKEAEKKGGFDGIFINEKGQVTEGGRTNLFIRNGDNWQTPPISCGLLPGVMRAIIIKDKDTKVQEAPLTPKDVIEAESVYICNSLRGLVEVDFSSLASGINVLEYSTIDEA